MYTYVHIHIYYICIYMHILSMIMSKIIIVHSWGLCVFTQVLLLHIYKYYVSIHTSIITTPIHIYYIHTTCMNMHFAHISIHTHCVLLYPKIKFCIRGGVCVSLLKSHSCTYICSIHTLHI